MHSNMGLGPGQCWHKWGIAPIIRSYAAWRWIDCDRLNRSAAFLCPRGQEGGCKSLSPPHFYAPPSTHTHIILHDCGYWISNTHCYIAILTLFCEMIHKYMTYYTVSIHCFSFGPRDIYCNYGELATRGPHDTRDQQLLTLPENVLLNNKLLNWTGWEMGRCIVKAKPYQLVSQIVSLPNCPNHQTTNVRMLYPITDVFWFWWNFHSADLVVLLLFKQPRAPLCHAM